MKNVPRTTPGAVPFFSRCPVRESPSDNPLALLLILIEVLLALETVVGQRSSRLATPV